MYEYVKRIYNVKIFKYGTLLLVYYNDVRLTLFQNTFNILHPQCLINFWKNS